MLIYTQSAALSLRIEQRLLERAAEAIERASSSPAWIAVLRAIADRHELIESHLRCVSIVRDSVELLLRELLEDAPPALPDPPAVLAPASKLLH